MIYDKLSNLNTYKGISSNLDTAIDFILTHDLNTLTTGKNLIDGDLVFANVMDASTDLAENKQYEMHQNYLDIQINLIGAERILTGDRMNMKMGDYNPDGDYSLGTAALLADCLLGPGNFVICMTGEPHMPGVAIGKPSSIRKCVFKVRW